MADRRRRLELPRLDLAVGQLEPPGAGHRQVPGVVGAQAVRRLAADADVVTENFRPGLMTRFGLAPEDLRRANPGLVTCSLTAFGGDAGEANVRPGYDIIVQALSGLISITGEREGEPT